METLTWFPQHDNTYVSVFIQTTDPHIWRSVTVNGIQMKKSIDMAINIMYGLKTPAAADRHHTFFIENDTAFIFNKHILTYRSFTVMWRHDSILHELSVNVNIFRSVSPYCTGPTNSPQQTAEAPEPRPAPPDTSLQCSAHEDQTDSHTRWSITAADSSDELQTETTRRINSFISFYTTYTNPVEC